MIVTLTLNPSLDLTYDLAGGPLGDADVQRAARTDIEASGKGVNVSRDLHAADVATLAVVPVAGPTGRHLVDLLAADGVPHEGVELPGETRINTTILHGDGETTKVNAPGTPMSEADLDAVLDATGRVLERLRRGAAADAGERGGRDELWLVLAGSLPPGLAPEIVRAVIDLAHRHTARCAVDVSGPALELALHAKADLLSPNAFELGELLGSQHRSDDIPALGAVARQLARTHGTELLVSLGADGALQTSGGAVLHGHGPRLRPVNTAGAGDAFLSGWLAAPGTPDERLRRAQEWGRSACLCPTTVDPQPGSRGIEGITVTTLDLD